MSNTPLTDALYRIQGYDSLSSDGKICKWADHARGLESQLAEARAGINAVQSLIESSHGVAGLHLNGDIAPWSELLEGGRFEEWLVAFSKALKGGGE
jgi:hypothetical protein